MGDFLGGFGEFYDLREESGDFWGYFRIFSGI